MRWTSRGVGRDGRDECDVREVRPACEGVVEDEDVAWFRVLFEDGVDGAGHRAEVDQDVFGLGDEAPVGVE